MCMRCQYLILPYLLGLSCVEKNVWAKNYLFLTLQYWHEKWISNIYISRSFLSDEKSKNQLLTSKLQCNLYTNWEWYTMKNLTWVYPHYIEKYAKFLYGIYFKMKIMGGMRILWCTRIIPLQKKLAKFHFHNQVKLRSIKILIGSSQNSSHTLFHFLLIIFHF